MTDAVDVNMLAEEDVFSWLLGGMDVGPSGNGAPQFGHGGAGSQQRGMTHTLKRTSSQNSIERSLMNGVPFSTLPMGSTEKFTWAESLFEDLSDNSDPQSTLPASNSGASQYPDFGDVMGSGPLKKDNEGDDWLVAEKALYAASAEPTPSRATKTNGRASTARNTAPKRKRGGATSRPLSPKSLAQREKNREAVRNCRKRKKEHTQVLREKSVALEEENARLRLQLQLGSEEMQRLKNDEGEELVREIAAIVGQSKGSSLTQRATGDPKLVANLEGLIAKYWTRLGDHGKHRHAAISYILSRLNRLLQPARPTKMYLWQMAQENSFFEHKGGLWQAMCKELQLTPDQQQSLKKRRRNVSRLRSDIAAAMDKLNDVQLSLANHNKATDGTLFRMLETVFGPHQVAQIINLAHDDKSGNAEMLEECWKNTTTDLDKQLDAELEDREKQNVEQAKMELLKRSEESSHELLQYKRRNCVRETKKLFEVPFKEMEQLASVMFSDKVVLYDPNNGGEFVGLHMVLRYIRRICLAFSYHTKDEDKLVADELRTKVEDDKARGSWTLTGTYHGMLARKNSRRNLLSLRSALQLDKEAVEGNDVAATPGEAPATGDLGSTAPKGTATAAHLGDPPPATTSTATDGEQTDSDGERGQRVSFKVVIAFKFAPKSEKIDEMVVSWDALSLMRQLKLLPPEIESQVPKPSPAPEKHFTKMTPKQAEEVCKKLTTLFECSSSDEGPVMNLAKDILDPICVFHDSNMGGKFTGIKQCVEYVRRLRRPFPSLRVKNMNVSTISKSNSKQPRMQMGWAVEGMYGGALVDQHKKCTFNAVMFVGFSPSRKIADVQMSWNATTLMQQLGVIATDDS